VAAARRGLARWARPYTCVMHGMLSAAILIGVFAAVTLACAYVAGRVYLAAAGRPQGRQGRRGRSS
jgi:hypothetical protein